MRNPTATDSGNPVLFRIPLWPDGALPTAGQVQRVPLTGTPTASPPRRTAAAR